MSKVLFINLPLSLLQFIRNFHGSPINRIDSSKKKTEKIATRSASGMYDPLYF